MENTIQRRLCEITELNRQNYFLRQESILMHKKMNDSEACLKAFIKANDDLKN